ncbi:MAG: type II secretion system F family protein [Dehalococcoidales bacterium]
MASTTGLSAEPKKVTYRYEAYDRRGKLVKGNLKASSEFTAEQQVVARGLDPLNVEVAPSMFTLEEALPSLFRVKPRDIIVFSKQLATLLQSGISLLPSLEILHGQVASSRGFRRVLDRMIFDIRAGASFSDAIRRHPKVFSDIYSRTMVVGEHSGSLEGVLHRMAGHIERQGVITQKITKALTYPAIVITVGLLVVILLMTVVMPQLIGMFESMQAELPLPTVIMIALTNFVTSYQLEIVIGVAVIAALVLWLVRLPAGRRVFDRLRLQAPVIGPPTLMGEMARFARTVSVMVGTGMNLQEIMEMVPHTTSNSVMRNALHQVNDALLLGEGMSGPMSHIPLFPALLVQMVAVGEETNTMEFTMGVVADFYETTAEEKAQAMVALVGPLSTIGIALLVGFIAVSIMLPMYTLTGSF